VNNMEKESHTVKKVAELAKTTIKTLHHYHKIELLRPKSISDAGYRLYGYDELQRLQEILFYRELSIPLKQILLLLQGTPDRTKILKEQYLLLHERQQHIDQLLQTLTISIRHAEEGKTMDTATMFKGFTAYSLEHCDRHDDICLFADKDVKKGEPVYNRASPKLDDDIKQEDFDTMDAKMQKQVLENSHWDELEQTYHADFDILSFIRHSDKPTLIQDSNHSDVYLVAARDIKSGSEITR